MLSTLAWVSWWTFGFFVTRHMRVYLIKLLIETILNPYLFTISQGLAGFVFRIIIRIVLTTSGIALGYLLLTTCFSGLKLHFLVLCVFVNYISNSHLSDNKIISVGLSLDLCYTRSRFQKAKNSTLSFFINFMSWHCWKSKRLSYNKNIRAHAYYCHTDVIGITPCFGYTAHLKCKKINRTPLVCCTIGILRCREDKKFYEMYEKSIKWLAMTMKMWIANCGTVKLYYNDNHSNDQYMCIRKSMNNMFEFSFQQ